jgi:hypothetical protein
MIVFHFLSLFYPLVQLNFALLSGQMLIENRTELFFMLVDQLRFFEDFCGAYSTGQGPLLQLIDLKSNGTDIQPAWRAEPGPDRRIPQEPSKNRNDNIDKIIIDATERPCHRPHHGRKQKHYFSGKRRYHTLKNTVIGDVKNGIPVVGPTTAGSRHDYALLKDELNPNQSGLSSVEVFVDLAYQGIKDRYPTFHKIHIPYKKPRKSKDNPNPTLTPQQKKENRAISRIRVIVENLIGDMKSFQILSIKFRNCIKNFGDQVILMVAGLCNLKNHYVVQ